MFQHGCLDSWFVNTVIIVAYYLLFLGVFSYYTDINNNRLYVFNFINNTDCFRGLFSCYSCLTVGWRLLHDAEVKVTPASLVQHTRQCTCLSDQKRNLS
jgi:hypothetical protein